MSNQRAFLAIVSGLLCCLFSGCASTSRKVNRTECSVADSEPNRSRVVEIVSSVARTTGMHDYTEDQLARLSARRSPRGYALLVAYSDTPAPKNRLSLWVTSRQGTVSATLRQRKWTKSRTDPYLAVEGALTNAFTKSFGQGVTIRSDDYWIK